MAGESLSVSCAVSTGHVRGLYRNHVLSLSVSCAVPIGLMRCLSISLVRRLYRPRGRDVLPVTPRPTTDG